MKTLRRWFYRIFKRYRRIELIWVNYHEADQLIRDNADKAPTQQWHIAPEEDHNQVIGMVYLERKERIVC